MIPKVRAKTGQRGRGFQKKHVLSVFCGATLSKTSTLMRKSMTFLALCQVTFLFLLKTQNGPPSLLVLGWIVPCFHPKNTTEVQCTGSKPRPNKPLIFSVILYLCHHLGPGLCQCAGIRHQWQALFFLCLLINPDNTSQCPCHPHMY